MITYLEYRSEKSSKFWEIEVKGTSYTVRYGKIGTLGTLMEESWGTAEIAQQEAERLIRSKKKKGYQEAERPTEEELLEKKTVRAKEEKVKSVAEAGIDAVVPPLLESTGYDYQLVEGKTGSLLRVKLKGKRYVELSLPHKTFMKRLNDIVPTVELVKELMEKLEVDLTLGKKSFDGEWGGAYLARRDDWWLVEEYQGEFWEERAFAYGDPILLADLQPEEKEIDLAEVAKWDIPGLRKEVVYDREEPDRVIWIKYGGSWLDLLEVWPRSIRFRVGRARCERWWSQWKRVPSLASLRSFLEGMVGELAKIHDAHQDAQLAIVKREEARAEAMRDALGAAGYEQVFVHFDRPRIRNAYTYTVHVGMKGRQVLVLRMTEGEVDGKAALVAPTADLVKEAMAKSRIPFKIF